MGMQAANACIPCNVVHRKKHIALHNVIHYIRDIRLVGWVAARAAVRRLVKKESPLMATQTKTAKSGKPAAAAGFDAFKFEMPSMDIPASFRDFAEKGLAQARDTYAKMKSAAESAGGAVEDTFETAREGAFTPERVAEAIHAAAQQDEEFWSAEVPYAG